MLGVIRGSDINRRAALMDRTFPFPHAVFVAQKAWADLRQPDGRERDEFDDEKAVLQISLRGDEIVGYQRLLPTTRPHFLTEVLGDLCRERPPTGPRVFEWTRFWVAPGWRAGRPRPNGPFLELAQGVIERGLARRVDTHTVVIDWHLMVIAMQLRLFARPLGFRRKIGKDQVVALPMSFNREALDTIQQARVSDASVLSEISLPTAA